MGREAGSSRAAARPGPPASAGSSSGTRSGGRSASGVLIFLAVAPVMALTLFRQHRAGRKVQLPPGFGWWLAFLAFVVAGIAALGADPEGTVPDTAGGRMVAVVFRLGQYVALTVFLVYARQPARAPQQNARQAAGLAVRGHRRRRAARHVRRDVRVHLAGGDAAAEAHPRRWASSSRWCTRRPRR